MLSERARNERRRVGSVAWRLAALKNLVPSLTMPALVGAPLARRVQAILGTASDGLSSWEGRQQLIRGQRRSALLWATSSAAWRRKLNRTFMLTSVIPQG